MAKPKKLPLKNEKPVGTVDVSPDGECVVVGQQSETEDDAHLSVWSLNSRSEGTVLGRGGNVFITKARFRSDGRVLAYLNSRLEVWFYDLDEGSVVETPFDEEPVRWLSFAYDKPRLLLAGESTRVVDARAMKPVWDLPAVDRDLEDPARVGVLAADGTKAAVVGEDNEVAVYDVKSKKVVKRLENAPAQASWIAADARMHHVAVLDEETDGTFLWDVKAGKPVESAYVNEDAQGYSCLAFRRQGGLLALGMRLGFVEVLSIADDEYVLEEEAHDGRVSDLVFTPDGKRLISAGADGAVLIWDLG